MSSPSSAATDLMGQNWLTGLGDALDTMASVAVTEHEVAPAAQPMSQASGYAISDVFERSPPPAGATSYEAHQIYDYQTPLEPSARQLESYGALMRRMVAAAHLDDRFVDGPRMARWFEGLGALGLMPGKVRVRLQGETGLPSYASWAQVKAARELAQTAGAGSSLGRLSQLFIGLPPIELNKLKIEVVDLDPASQVRKFRIYADRWVDPGFVVRTTLHMAQPLREPKKKKLFGTAEPVPPLRLVDGEWKLNDALHDTLHVATGGTPAQLALTALHLAGDTLTAITQGVIGPVWFKGAEIPEMLAGLFDIAPDNTIAVFTSYELHRERPGDDTIPWTDPSDPALARILARGWHAAIHKLWVTTPELLDVIEEHAREQDPTLKVRTIY